MSVNWGVSFPLCCQGASRGATATSDELLKQLASRFHSLKWSSRSFAALSRIRIFPAVSLAAEPYPPQSATSDRIAVSLDLPCTLFQHASIAWTQLVLLQKHLHLLSFDVSTAFVCFCMLLHHVVALEAGSLFHVFSVRCCSTLILLTRGRSL